MQKRRIDKKFLIGIITFNKKKFRLYINYDVLVLLIGVGRQLFAAAIHWFGRAASHETIDADDEQYDGYDGK